MVHGWMHFRLTETESFEYIQIKFYGGVQVRWTVTHHNHNRSQPYTHRETYQSKRTYIHETRILWSSDQSPDGKIGPGTFNLPFQFVLPTNCLGTFQESTGDIGSITYTLHGLIRTGIFHRDHKIDVPVRVSKITDINLPQLSLPVTESKTESVGFFCFGSDVKFTVSLSRTGFCIGQNLPLTVNVVNGSSRRVKIRASVLRYCHYYAQGHVAHGVERNIATVMTTPIDPHSEQMVTIEDLTVPMVEPSFDGLDTIKMQYVLEVAAVIPWECDSSVKIPITLGNVPFNNHDRINVAKL